MRRNVSRTGLSRRRRHQRFIATWVDRLPDIPAFIIGNAPSLNDHDLDLLKDYFTIGVNRAFYAIDPTILLWQDISLWTSEYNKLHNTQSIKVVRDIADPRKIYYNFHLKSGPYQFDTTKTHILYGRGSTGPIALQLAVALGCRPIVMLGMDCRKGEKNESDFYGDNIHWTPHTLSQCQKGLDFIKEQCPVEVINVGLSNLWPQRKLKDVVEQIGTRYARGRQSYVKQLLGTS